MEIVFSMMKIYLLVVVVMTMTYMLRHYYFTLNRLFGVQRLYYHDIIDSKMPMVSVLVPMHNEEKVAENVLERLLCVDYPADKLEIIPVNDFSQDATGAILTEYAVRFSWIRPLHRYEGVRGKPAALNAAMEKAIGDIVIVFDADYLPPRSIVKDLAVCFHDPEVGAAMGRVVPVNAHKNILTRILDLERSGGYQVDQQARYNLSLIPQYGGTVGGFRRQVVLDSGGFRPKVLAEDTELTYRLLIQGWKVVYANRAECYEEVPETWMARARQVQRWSRGHNVVMFYYFFSVWRSPYLSWPEKVDGVLLLLVYFMPVLQLMGMLDSLGLFFGGEMQLFSGAGFFFFGSVYGALGTFAPFYQVGVSCLIDGSRQRLFFLPFLIFTFYFYLWYISCGFFQAIGDMLTSRQAAWEKTERFREGKARE